MADQSILDRLAALGIGGARADGLAATMDPEQVAKASDGIFRVMIQGRESGAATDHGHLFPDGQLYPA